MSLCRLICSVPFRRALLPHPSMSKPYSPIHGLALDVDVPVWTLWRTRESNEVRVGLRDVRRLLRILDGGRSGGLLLKLLMVRDVRGRRSLLFGGEVGNARKKGRSHGGWVVDGCREGKEGRDGNRERGL